MIEFGTNSLFKAISEARMVTPSDPLVVRQPPGALGFEVEETLFESISIIKSLSTGRNGKDG